MNSCLVEGNMITTSRLPSILFLLACAIFLAPQRPAGSQGKKKGSGTTPAQRGTKNKIEVEEFGGEFAQWVKSLTITSVDKLTFRYSTNEPAAVTAIWQVSDTPVTFSNQIGIGQAPHVIASGALGAVPAPGHVSQFEINFALFAPKI